MSKLDKMREAREEWTEAWDWVGVAQDNLNDALNDHSADEKRFLWSLIDDYGKAQVNLSRVESSPRLASGERVAWCKTHADWTADHLGGLPEDKNRCRWSRFVLGTHLGINGKKPCRFVSKLLVDYPTEETP